MTDVQSPDGLPVVRPTRARVEEMAAGIDRNPDDVVDEIPPHYQEATVQKIAVNAVMAGCSPEHFPVVVAAVEASLVDKFNLYGTLATTHPCWPSVIVNGPIVDEIGINAKGNAYGQGTRANSTIGRALTFVYMNIGGATPGTGDKATHGGPHKLGLCVAENEPENPWEPLHVERGFDQDQSTVTVVSSESPHNINNHTNTAVGVLTTVAQTMAITGSNLAYFNERAEPHVVLCPEHASIIADDGWTKEDAKYFLYDNARIPVKMVEEREEQGKGNGWPKRFKKNLKDIHEIPIAAKPEKFIITVSGGAGTHSLFHPTFGDTESVTRPIET